MKKWVEKRTADRQFPKVSVIGLLVIGLPVVMSLGGCGDRAERTGQFYDSEVEGLAFDSGSFSGFTDADGTFEYRPNETVTFSIGAITVGSVRGDDVLTPLELADTTDIDNDEVINIARLLQTLDSNDNPDDGITITERVRSAAIEAIDVTQTIEAFESDPNLLTLLSELSLGNELITVNAAREHLQSTLTDLGYNQAPEVDAGDNQTVVSEDEVTLTGQATDNDGFVVDFEWSYDQVDGDPDITFEDIDPNPTDDDTESDTDSDDTVTGFSVQFTAPDVDSTTVLIFTLTVEDDSGAEATDQVEVTVSPQ